MSKRKDPKRRTPGALDLFTQNGDAADRLAALDVVFASMQMRGEKVEASSERNDPVAEESTALNRLSALMGRKVADVRRVSIMRRGEGVPGVHQPLGWYLRWAGGGECQTFESHDLRREDRLNEVALTHWRRPLPLGRLTSDDGRRLIRLLHEVIEDKAATATQQSNTNMSTEDAR